MSQQLGGTERRAQIDRPTDYRQCLRGTSDRFPDKSYSVGQADEMVQESHLLRISRSLISDSGLGFRIEVV